MSDHEDEEESPLADGSVDDIDPEQALMDKLGLQGLNDAKPSGKQLHKALKYFDLGLKIEVTMVSKSDIMFLICNVCCVFLGLL